MNVSLILSAGVGTRFMDGMPKQYHLLLGREIIAYSVDAMKQSSLSQVVVIVAGAESVERLREQYSVPCVTGGSSRNASIKKGLDYIKTVYPLCENILINEAVRPFLTPARVDEYYRFLNDYDAVITAQPITDSLGREGEAVTDRSPYYLIQAPEAFHFDLLYRHFDADSPITATVQQLPAERNVKRYFDYKHNLKITFPEDLLYAEQMMKTLR